MKKLTKKAILLILVITAFSAFLTACSTKHFHVYDYETIVEPTCANLGIKRGVCSCGATKEKSTSALKHKYENEKCIVCGATTEEYFNFTLLSDDTYEISAKDTNNIPVEVVIPSTYKGEAVTSIKEEGFKSCYSLHTIKILDGVESIGNSAFQSCYYLRTIILPNSIISIGNNAFYNTAYYQDESNIENGILYIGRNLICAKYITSIQGEYKYSIKEGTFLIADKAFYNRSSTKYIEMPDSLVLIGKEAFYGCSSLTTVEIPNGVTSIGDGAFQDCPSLKSVKISDKITSIGDRLFYGCGLLTAVEIPNSVTSIGSRAFSYCSSLTSIEIPSSVTSISDGAFFDCRLLVNVNYLGTIDDWVQISFSGSNANPLRYAKQLNINGELVTKVKIISAKQISDYAFYCYEALTSVEIGDNVKTLGSNVFRGCKSLSSVVIGDGITSIGKYSFYDCNSLTSVVLSNSITSIDVYAFYGCNLLSNLYYKGSSSEWSNITIANFNAPLTKLTKYYYSEGEPTEEGNYWHYVDGEPTKW